MKREQTVWEKEEGGKQALPTAQLGLSTAQNTAVCRL